MNSRPPSTPGPSAAPGRKVLTMSQSHPVSRKAPRPADQLAFLPTDHAPEHWVRGLVSAWNQEDGPDLPRLFQRMGRSCKPLVRQHGFALVEQAIRCFCGEAPLQDHEGSFTRRWPDYRRVTPETFAHDFDLYAQFARSTGHPSTNPAFAGLFGLADA